MLRNKPQSGPPHLEVVFWSSCSRSSYCAHDPCEFTAWLWLHSCSGLPTDLLLWLSSSSSFPTFFLLWIWWFFIVVCVCAAQGKLQVTPGNLLFHYISLFPVPASPPEASVNLVFATGEHSWLSVVLLVTALSSRGDSRMLMKRLWMN